MFRLTLKVPRIRQPHIQRPFICEITGTSPSSRCLSTKTDSPPLSHEDRDFLHRSHLPSGHFQKSLHPLSIPKLETTCERYLVSQAVIQTEEDHAHTKACVEKFKTNIGPELQKFLQQQNKQNKNHSSYITEPWFDMYLTDRRPVALNHNPFVTFTDDDRPGYMDQLIRSTNMVVSSLRFMRTLDEDILEPDVYHLKPAKTDNMSYRKVMKMMPSSWASTVSMVAYKAFPLDMSQYPNLFKSTRIPKHGKDELYVDKDSKHMMVMRNGHMYMFDVIDDDGYIMAPEVIMSHLKYVLDDPRPANPNSLGTLTTLNRDKWATVRQQLVNADAANEVYLQLVDSAIFNLVLDDHSPSDPNAVTRNFLHGDGTNRWFDKSFSLILTKDGVAAVNFEHAWGDGVAVLRYFKEVYADTTNRPAVNPDTQPASIDSDNFVQKLDYTLPPVMVEYIQESQRDFTAKCSSLDVDHLEYTTFTKPYLQKQGVSPDSVLQLVIQMAYYKQYGKMVPTYESCSTAAFKRGRTETVRSATRYTKQACEMFNRKTNPCSNEELINILKECSKLHSGLTSQAAMGKGWDRHLFALKYLANKSTTHRDIDIYTDPGYININNIILSTSTLSSPAVVIGGFGAVTPDGYGVGYSVEKERIGFNVTNYPPATNVHEYIDCLKESLDDIHAVFEGRQPSSYSS